MKMAHIITKPLVDIAPEIIEQIRESTQEEGQVIVHCIYNSLTGGDGIRIWPTTYLFDLHSDHVSTLEHIEKISLFPIWTWTRPGDNLFTLIFSGLPKSCTVFDLIEDCSGSVGAFRVSSIKRTTSDVYYVSL